MQNLCIIEVALLCILLFHVNKNTSHRASHIYPENFSEIFTIEAYFWFSILLRFFSFTFSFCHVNILVV